MEEIILTSHAPDKRQLRENRKKNRKKRAVGDVVFDVINTVLMSLFFLMCLLPLINVLSVSFSTGGTEVFLLPKKATLYSYKLVLQESGFYTAYGISLFTTVVVVVLSTTIMALTAYPLSKPDLPFRKGILFFFIVTMLFSAGIIPSFFLIKMMGIMDTLWALIIPPLLNVFNILLIKTSFENLPSEMEEAAKIDGASDIRLFFSVVIPMSLPVIATVVFFTAVGSWNNYAIALYYLPNAQDKFPLAMYIYMLTKGGTGDTGDPIKNASRANIEAATIVLSILPMVILYPFIMKYFKGGIMLGSVKG